VIYGQNTNKQAKLRFAPSPNGLLHLGHAYSALLTAQVAQALSGSFHLRIEDIDKHRSKKEYILAIYRDLHWLGLQWPEPVRRQSDHLESYQKALSQLGQADLLYPCFATRGDIKTYWQDKSNPPRDPDGGLIYPGLYKDLKPQKAQERIKAGEPYAFRLHLDRAIERAKQLQQQESLSYQTYQAQAPSQPLQQIEIENLESWGDVIIARKDIPTSYHLSVVVDDHLEGITHVCRGKDLQAATDIHRILQVNLGIAPPYYHHHDLIKWEGKKLSKSQAHPSLYELRKQGLTAKTIRDAANKGINSLEELMALI